MLNRRLPWLPPALAYLTAAFLAVIAIFVFGQALNFPFLWDETITHITANPYLKTGNWHYFWLQPYAYHYIPVTYTIWYLLSLLSQGVGASAGFFHPGIYHGANILLHWLNALLLYLLLARHFTSRHKAALASLLFLVHPLQVESVAWISELRGLLAASFSLLALHSHLQSATSLSAQRRWLLQFISALCFVLAMLSKPNAVALAFAYILLDFYQAIPWRRIFGFFILRQFLIVPLILLTIQGESGNLLVPESGYIRIFVFLDAIGFYLEKFLLPVNLAACYGRTPAFILTDAATIFHLFLALIFLFFAWYWRRRLPKVSLAMGLSIIALLPNSGLFAFAFQEWSTVADRYSYFSLMPLAALGVEILCLSRLASWQQVTITAYLLLLLAAISRQVQLPVWRSELALWGQAIAISPHSPYSWINHGVTYQEKDEDLLAIKDFTEAIKLKDDFAIAYNNRGMSYHKLKAYPQALADYEQALKLDATYAAAYNNKGLLHLALGQVQAARDTFAALLALMPTYPDAYLVYGKILMKLGQTQEALASFEKARRVNTQSLPALLELAAAYETLGAWPEAEAAYQRALALTPQNQDLQKRLQELNERRPKASN